MNGASWTSSYTSRSDQPLRQSGAIRVFTGYSGTVTDGGVGMVMVFNKMITDTEVSTIFDTTRKRFGV